VRRRRWSLLGEGILAVAVLIAGLLVLGDATAAAPHFEYLFLRRDLTRAEWGDNYTTHSHPMVSRYIMGGWLWLQGYNLRRLPPPYRWSLSREANRRQGRVPDEALLAQARAPMVLSSAGAVSLLYVLGRVLAGPLAGLTTAAVVLASPLAQEYLVRARPDPPLIFFLVLALLLGVLGARRRPDGALPIVWAIAVGVALGLAVASKLPALMSLVAVSGWAVLVGVLAAARGREPADRSPWIHLARAWAASRGWALALVVAAGLFVLTNPHLYPNPVVHTTHMFRLRLDEQESDQRHYPWRALRTPLEQASFVLGGSLADGTFAGSRGVPAEALFAAVGAAVLLVTTCRDWRRTGRAPAAGLVLMTAAAYFVGTTALIAVTYDRYLVIPLLFGALLSGLGIAALVRRGLALASAGSRRTPGERPAPAYQAVGDRA
jgi:4-amino-4-deoxy-L-arabinose transferase-like glycosyltransferase